MITDDLSSYQGLVDFGHKLVKTRLPVCQGTGSYQGHGIVLSCTEASPQRHISQTQPKHSNRYIQEFAVRHNIRPNDTENLMALIACGMVGKRLRNKDLIS
ncbi:MAG: hypothetical protein F4082_00830 [Gammaproteobacteria bacterium]|nr:hypothetical protein [Gammaproteobacteria bacterium]